MGRTPEIPPPVALEYRELLKSEIDDLGRDRIAEFAGIDPSTVWRNVSAENLTYTTAMKLREAIARAHLADTGKPMRFIPPPFVAVVSQGHYDLCEITARIHGLDGEAFGAVMELAVSKLQEIDNDRILADANRGIAHPLRKPNDGDDRGG